VCALRIRKAIDPILLGERLYVHDMDAGVELELADGYNCTICTCWICCNGHDHYHELVRIACRKYAAICITTRFNVEALYVFNVERMVQSNDKRRFWWVVVESLGLGVGDFGCGGLQRDKPLE